ncbi:hypothetical protein TNCV_1705601 [Trichonephila clavipes]|uniref:Uncharacterized protein n=1 Tax=Trichonephila clavipes TaxID=2585209 RepID=A0A8X6R918_TRICX|nr:hypothetical protein TNCV_1705601 [Trichonephila clavipes]
MIWCGSSGCNLDQSLNNHGLHVFYRRKIPRRSRPGIQFYLVIEEEPLDNANMAVAKSEGQEGQLVPAPRRCSAGCFKYHQCVLEKCERDIQYHPIP